ncbi:hypothetical protein B296_00033806, partial [Ensete ventricosum]
MKVRTQPKQQQRRRRWRRYEGLPDWLVIIKCVGGAAWMCSASKFAEQALAGSGPCALACPWTSRYRVAMISSDSSTSVRVVSPPGSGETSRSDPEVDSSGASFGPPSPVDARVQRDLKVMMSDHDLDTAVTEGSLAVIRERYNIPAEYGLHVPEPGQRPYSSDVPDMCISVDALEVGLRWAGYYLIAQVGFRVSGAPSSNKGWKSRYLYVSGPAWGFGLDWSANPISNAPPYLSEEETVLVRRLKGILSSSRAIKEMAELWLVEAGL